MIIWILAIYPLSILLVIPFFSTDNLGILLGVAALIALAATGAFLVARKVRSGRSTDPSNLHSPSDTSQGAHEMNVESNFTPKR